MHEQSKSSPLVTYFLVWGALLLGTFLTYEVAKIDLGPFNPVVALAGLFSALRLAGGIIPCGRWVVNGGRSLCR